MALDILHDNWGPYTHTEVENALKAYLAALEDRINQAIQEGGVGLTDLSLEVQALLSKAETALQPENLAPWAKAQNKPGYTVSEITGVEGFQNLLAKLQDMDQKIQAAAQSGVTIDPQLADSGNPVANRAVKAAIDTLTNTLNTLIGSGNVQGAIDTFNEVVAFLNDINSSDTLAAKLATLVPQTRTVNGKRLNNNIVIGMADIPGLLQAIANAGSGAVSVQQNADGSFSITVGNDTYVFDDFPTKQDMADAIDDALGEAQVTVVPADSVGVISSLGSDSDEDALSASMGKKLRVAITTILNSLGNYAFPDGKPVIDWGDDTPVTYTVSKTIGTGLSATGGDTDVNDGDPLEVTIAITNNLYIIDDNSVVVTMGGSPVAGAWNASTMKVTIAAVTGDVVINVPSLTYVGYGEQNSPLVLMFDGKNQGSTASQWENLANANKPLVLSGGYTKNTDNVQFGGTDGRGIIQNFGTDLPYNTATLEAVLSFGVLPTSAIYVFGSGNDHNSLIYVGDPTSSSGRKALFSRTKGEHSSAPNNVVVGYIDTAANNFLFAANQVISLSRQGERYTLNTDQLSTITGNSGYIMVGDSGSTFNAAGYIFVSGCTTRTGAYFAPFQGKMYCIRAYTRALTESEVAQNYKVDKKRFNIA